MKTEIDRFEQPPTIEDQVASAVLNGPSELVGEICGIQFRTSKKLTGSKLAVFGYPGDPNPRNYCFVKFGP